MPADDDYLHVEIHDDLIHVAAPVLQRREGGLRSVDAPAHVGRGCGDLRAADGHDGGRFDDRSDGRSDGRLLDRVGDRYHDRVDDRYHGREVDRAAFLYRHGDVDRRVAYAHLDRGPVAVAPCESGRRYRAVADMAAVDHAVDVAGRALVAVDRDHGTTLLRCADWDYGCDRYLIDLADRILGVCLIAPARGVVHRRLFY